jgi:citrate lyase subunit beta/citryl-CoA lyase
MISARSLLFVPATSERKIDKAYLSGADGVILDLEDAVAVSEKPSARAAIAAIVATPRHSPTWVRVNASTTPHCYPDLLAVCVPGIFGVVLPKAESAEEIRMIDWVMTQLEKARELPQGGITLMAIVETARGLEAVSEIAKSSPRLRRLIFGAVDLAADVGIDLEDGAGATAQARFAIACASRAAGIAAPMDTAFTNIQDLEALRATSIRARGLGYRGKCCIHPAQIEVVNAVFTPSAEDISRARRIVAAFEAAERSGAAAVSMDGFMIDYPVADKARQLLASVAGASGDRKPPTEYHIKTSDA